MEIGLGYNLSNDKLLMAGIMLLGDINAMNNVLHLILDYWSFQTKTQICNYINIPYNKQSLKLICRKIITDKIFSNYNYLYILGVI